MRDNGNDFVFFVLGGLAGASLAPLLAPRPGRETRQMVASRIRDGERYARRGIERGRKVVARTVREGKDLAQRTLSTGREIVETRRGIGESGRDIVEDAPGMGRTSPQPVPVEKLT
jgi:gas vesicle protein